MAEPTINLLGHSYAPIGVGGHVRCTYRAMRSVAMRPSLTDIYIQRLGKPVIATGYSGNMELTDEETSFPVTYDLIPLVEGDYLHWEDQVWADVHVANVVLHMIRLVDTPELGRTVGNRAKLHMQKNFSYSAIGMNYRIIHPLASSVYLDWGAAVTLSLLSQPQSWAISRRMVRCCS